MCQSRRGRLPAHYPLSIISLMLACAKARKVMSPTVTPCPLCHNSLTRTTSWTIMCTRGDHCLFNHLSVEEVVHGVSIQVQSNHLRSTLHVAIHTQCKLNAIRIFYVKRLSTLDEVYIRKHFS